MDSPARAAEFVKMSVNIVIGHQMAAELHFH
jgi:hypothetical protein